MSDPYPPSPYPSQPIPYAQAYAPAGPPTSIKVIGIVGVVLGSLALFFRAIGIVFLFVMPRMYAAYGSAYFWFTTADAALFAAAGAVLLVGSVGCLSHREWGRRTLLRWAVLYPAVVVVELVVMAVYLLPIVAQSQPAGPTRSMIVTAGVVVNAVKAVAACVYPAFVLVLFRRPAVRAAFA